MSENGEIYTAGKKIYTAAGSDVIDKYHLWVSDFFAKFQIWSDVRNVLFLK